MKQIREVPYYTWLDDARAKSCAERLRQVFLPQVRRRMPWHHLNGQKHDFIVNFVKKWKKDYPWYFRSDISKFYPKVSAIDLITQLQLAYRDLFGLDFVPKKFKQTFMPDMLAWARSLPTGRGIPLGSSMSAIMAPLALMPVWLRLQRKLDIKMIVYMDDVLMLCKDESTCREAWHLLSRELDINLHLELNIDKTRCGRFASQPVEFCGWNFSGGYVTVQESKIQAFRSRVEDLTKRCAGKEGRAYIKLLNRKIDGFGNYYKYGHVLRQFEALDCYIRGQARLFLCGNPHSKSYDSKKLETIGLRSLKICYHRAHSKQTPVPVKQRALPAVNVFHKRNSQHTADGVSLNALVLNSEKLCSQLSQLIASQRQIQRLMENALGFM